MSKSDVLEYLNRARELNMTPNFWLSEAYLSIQNVRLETGGGVIWLQEEGLALFPPLPAAGRPFPNRFPPMRVWSDFANYSVGEPVEFLDWEYWYDSDQFRRMQGGEWAVFRKNSRKWPRGKQWKYVEQPPPNKDIEALLIKWLERKVDQEIHDSETMLWFLFNGQRRAFLLHEDRLVGVNVWDHNGSYLMYRYCITDPEEPFLNEFARLLFYLSVPGRMVIDGGSLGSPGLERFKDKLNPMRKRPVYSRIVS